MSELTPEVEPGEVGFDAERLRRIDEHFAEYVDAGKLPGTLVLVARHGKIAHLSTCGWRDVEAQAPVTTDTLYRIFSMTKPVTSVAAMMLYERGLFELTDPVAEFIPAFAEPRVYTGGPPDQPETRPATEPMRIWHLLTHTAGLTYGFHRLHPVDKIYRDNGFELGNGDRDLATACEDWAKLPLLFDPGQRWNYSVATDVLGRIVEVVSGQRLDEFFRENILEPLDMHDTSFHVPESEADRLAALYRPDRQGRAVRHDKVGRAALQPQKFLSGGGGLISTAHDYHRFTTMLLRGGELDGVRLLGNRTVAYMTRNHLPGGTDLETLAMGAFSESANAGKGFGLGFGVTDDAAAGKVLTSSGEYFWGGLASTGFWVDPVEDMTVLLMTQLMPSSTYPLRPQLHQLVYQSLVD